MKYIYQHAVCQCKHAICQYVNVNMQYVNMQYVNVNMQYVNVNMQYVLNANMQYTSMQYVNIQHAMTKHTFTNIMYSMPDVNVHAALTTCIHIGGGTLIYLGGHPNLFIIHDNCLKELYKSSSNLTWLASYSDNNLLLNSLQAMLKFSKNLKRHRVEQV